MQSLPVDQIEAVHLLFVPVLLVPMPAQETKLLHLFVLLLRRHVVLYTELQLPEQDPFMLQTPMRRRQLRLLQPSQLLRLQDTLHRLRRLPLPAAVLLQAELLVLFAQLLL